MKFKTLAAMCKKEGIFRLFNRVNDDGEVTEQWMGTGGAVYPLSGLPYLTEENLVAMLDITEKQRESIFFSHNTLPEGISFEHTAAGEVMLDREKMTLGYGGRVVRPLITRGGLSFIDVEYLSPLADVIDVVELYERRTPDGGIYFAAKAGLMIAGVFMPLAIVEEKLVEGMEMLAERCREALNVKNERERRARENEPQQTAL